MKKNFEVKFSYYVHVWLQTYWNYPIIIHDIFAG